MPSLLLAVVAVVVLAGAWLMPGGAGQFGLALGIILPIVLIVWGIVLFWHRMGGGR